MGRYVSIAALLAGCGATLEDPSTSADLSGEPTATSYLSQLAKLDCDQAFKCKTSYPTNADVTFEQAWGRNPQECYALYLADLMPALVEADIVRGTIQFDPSAAAKCLAGTKLGTCSEYWKNGPDYANACDEAFKGQLSDGKTCAIDIECDSAFCDLSANVCAP